MPVSSRTQSFLLALVVGGLLIGFDCRAQIDPMHRNLLELGYLHIMDTLESAAGFGINVGHDNKAGNGSPKISLAAFDEEMDFETLMKEWIPLTRALNSINRGMGLSDLYPFVIPPAVVEKLRFIHSVIHAKEMQSVPDAQLVTA